MKKSLARLIALGVVLAVPAGVFAQSAQTTTESKSSTNPVTGTRTQSTESKTSTNVGGKKTTTHRKHTKKHSKKKSTDKMETKTETKPSSK